MKQVINNRINYQPTVFSISGTPKKLLPWWPTCNLVVIFFHVFFSWGLRPATKQVCGPPLEQLAGGQVPTTTWCGCFLKWWYPQNTPKWSLLVGKPMVVGYHHFRKPPINGVYFTISLIGFLGKPQNNQGFCTQKPRSDGRGFPTVIQRSNSLCLFRCTFHPTRSSLDPTTRWCSASPPCQPPPEQWLAGNLIWLDGKSSFLIGDTSS